MEEVKSDATAEVRKIPKKGLPQTLPTMATSIEQLCARAKVQL
jgi:hypothetical protein